MNEETRLYYVDSHLSSFEAVVTGCEPAGSLFAVTTDRTAFFPESGGQCGDRGRLNGVPVLDTQETNGRILHLCASPLPVGTAVHGELDWEARFSNMQSHSAEHIISGLAYGLWGCENVGFHLSDGVVTMDLSQELDREQLQLLERRANEVVWRNVAVRGWFPDSATLETMNYRQKKPLSGAIRIVEIEGVDRCACCVPHVDRTGEIGLIRLTDAMRHRGGMRLTLLAGRRAWEDVFALYSEAERLSALYSAPRHGLVPAAERIMAEKEAVQYTVTGLERELTALTVASRAPTDRNLLLFVPASRSAAAMRELADGCAEKCTGLAAVFAGEDGAWRYVIASRHISLRANAKSINAAIAGRGGGSDAMLQGSCTADRAALERWAAEFNQQEE